MILRIDQDRYIKKHRRKVRRIKIIRKNMRNMHLNCRNIISIVCIWGRVRRKGGIRIMGRWVVSSNQTNQTISLIYQQGYVIASILPINYNTPTALNTNSTETPPKHPTTAKPPLLSSSTPNPIDCTRSSKRVTKTMKQC